MSHLYYKLKPYIPRNIQILLRRRYTLLKKPRYKSVWPIDPKSATLPTGWCGWPEGKRFAFVLSHDVESAKGLRLIPEIVKMEQAFGLRSSFNFVAGDYSVPDDLFHFLRESGCEIGVHGLHHKGNLFASYSEFLIQAKEINKFLKEWHAVGFRSPSMYHNLEWIHHLNIEYDSSTFDTDPFEPQNDGTGTIFPFHVHHGNGNRYVELPYTLPQDFTVFILMGEKNIDIWKHKTQWVVEQGGMAFINVHPDYMNDGSTPSLADEYPLGFYREFLTWVYQNYKKEYWHALPREISQYFSQQQAVSRIETPRHETRLETSQAQEITPMRAEEWDRFVTNHPHGWITHLSEWSLVLEKSFPHMKGHYFTINDHDGDICAALPIYEVNSWLLGKRLVSTPFATLSDPLVSREEDSQTLLASVFELFHQLKASSIEIRCFNASAILRHSNMKPLSTFKQHYLMLNRPIEEMMRTFHNSCVKRKISKLNKNNLQLVIGESEESLRIFYHLYCRSRKRLGLPAQPYIFFKSLWEHFHQQKYMRVMLAQKDGIPIGGMIVFMYKNRCSVEYLGSEISYRNVNPDHFLWWEAIRMAHKEGFEVFDFGRTSIFNTSLMDFKGRWGTAIRDLPQYHYPVKSDDKASHKKDSSGVKIVKAVCRHIPEGLYSHLGEFFYRHLG